MAINHDSNRDFELFEENMIEWMLEWIEWKLQETGLKECFLRPIPALFC